MKLSLVTLVLGVLALTTIPPALAGGNAEAGKAVFAKRCKICHGKQGEGNPAIAKALKVPLKPLGSKEVQSKGDEELKKQITEGEGKMKPVKGLSTREIDNVIALLRGFTNQ